MQPLAERMRPRSLDEYVGQRHLVGPGAVLRQAIESGKVPSFIMWGPPGVGKTTLAWIIAQQLERPFHSLSAINSGVKDIREAIEKARKQRFFDRPNPILFIDEIHRFSKSQQDALLGAVEKGVITLIGATTENPSFEVISALLSRCQVYVLEPLSREELVGLVERALKQDEYLRKLDVEVAEYEALLQFSGGDARKLYNALELVTHFAEPGKPFRITNALVTEKIQRNIAQFDKGGEWHYDIASAFIKSIRGSDPDAAVYWLARMIEGGEDVKFIARRLMISAAEDIGLANPNALLLATTAFQAVQAVGLPEARIILSEAAIYLATSPKSNSAYLAINKAQQAVREHGSLPVPLHLRNAPTTLMKQLGYGKGYRYAHDFEGHFAAQLHLPEALQNARFYEPAENPQEKRILQFLLERWKERYGAK
ncbi:MAG: replication-associated recombination protein A [Bacteroidetes bacterium]|nr:MAG: replication-associated recombination protein A [Bacteroidota bacterium]